MSGPTRRRQERDWPTLPVPFFGFRVIYEELATREWRGVEGSLPALKYADKAKILSALAHPFASAGGEDLYPTVPAKAAAMFRGLVKNHGPTDSPTGGYPSIRTSSSIAMPSESRATKATIPFRRSSGGSVEIPASWLSTISRYFENRIGALRAGVDLWRSRSIPRFEPGDTRGSRGYVL